MSEEDPCQEYRDKLAKYRKERDDIKALLGDGWKQRTNGEDMSKDAIIPNDERRKMQKRYDELVKLIKTTSAELAECEAYVTKK